MDDLEQRLKILHEEYPIQTFNGASMLITHVRRMRAEKEMGIPIKYRTGSVISVEFSTAANQLAEEQWEKLYGQMCEDLLERYPDKHRRMFG